MGYRIREAVGAFMLVLGIMLVWSTFVTLHGALAFWVLLGMLGFTVLGMVFTLFISDDRIRGNVSYFLAVYPYVITGMLFLYEMFVVVKLELLGM